MTIEALGNICEIVGGNAAPKGDDTFGEEGLPFVKMKDLGRQHLSVNLIEIENKVSETVGKRNGLKIVKKGAILIPRSGSVGLNHRAILGVDAYIVSHICALIVKNEKKVFNKFLYYYLTTINFESIKKKTTGLDAITFQDLAKVKIPVPPISDQIRIANILSKAEALISQRKESLRLLDELLKSTFLEMFGDPVRNEKEWEVNSLTKFGSFKNGLNYTRNETGVGVRCLGVGDFKDLSKLSNFETLPILNLTTAPSIDYYLKDGDLVFVRSNGNRELVGRCILVFPKSEIVTYSGFCIRYRIEKDGVNAIYLSHLFRVPAFRKSMLQGGRGANIQNINQQTLAGLKIPTPPLKLQTQFAHIVEKTEALKAHYQTSLQELENLYGSLSQRAFKGELNLNSN